MPTTPESNHLLWESVRKEKDVAKALVLAADVGEEAIKASIADRERIRDSVVELRKLIAGNGDPTHSLLSRVTSIENQMQLTCAALTAMQTFLIGDITGDKDSLTTKLDGLGDRLEEVEKASANASKIVWVILTVVVGQVVLKVVGLF